MATDTATADETQTATVTATLQPPQPVERAGVSFLIPEGWVGTTDTWVSEETGVALLFTTTDQEPPMEPEAAMLPEGAVNLDREEIETPLGPGAIHTIELTDVTEGPLYERHAIVRTAERFYAWSLRAESVEALDEHQQALDFVLASLEPLEEEDDGDPLNPVG